MKMVLTPPSKKQREELFSKLNIEKFSHLFYLKNEDLKIKSTPYPHWDELQYKTPPQGLSLEEWWAAIKLNRKNSSQINIEDPKRNPFIFALPDPIPERLHIIDSKASGIISSSNKALNEDDKDQYYIQSLIKESVTSSQLEGASTTIQAAKEMINSGRKPINYGEKMIYNNYLTMKKIRELKDEKLTKELIFEIHQMITKDTLKNPDSAGRFRTNEENIRIESRADNEILYIPPDADLLDERVQAICDFANIEDKSNFIHPVIRAIIIHFLIGYEHPFVDGNGRTARAIFFWALLKYGYWMSEYISISDIILQAPNKYVRAYLYTETDDNDLTYFILYHTEILIKAIDQLYNYISERETELETINKLIKSSSHLNIRQRYLLSNAIEHPNKLFSISYHKNNNNITYETARKDLTDLVRMNFMTIEIIGRTNYFRPVKNLSKKISS